MTELTQLERARKVVADFVPQDKPGCKYIYAYLGKATYDATQYEFIDGLCLAGKRIWHLDESRADCVAYVGIGVRDRISLVRKHPLIPSSRQLRIKLLEKLSSGDAKELECKLIKDLGCILDPNRPDGCLANTKLSQSGNDCTTDLRLEAARYKSRVARSKKRGLFVAFTSDKAIVASGYLHQISQQLDVHPSTLNRVLRNERISFVSPVHKQAIYICDIDSYQDFICKIAPNPCATRKRILHVQSLSGGEVFIGTAVELASKLNISQPEGLHRVAKRHNNALQVDGYIAAYGTDPILTDDERYQLNQRIVICCNQAKDILFVGSRSEVAAKFQISKHKVDNRMQHQSNSPVFSPRCEEYIYFVNPLRFSDFLPKEVLPRAHTVRQILKVTSLDGSRSFTGTSQELKPLLGIERVDGLHISARSGGLRTTRGWRAVYVDQ